MLTEAFTDKLDSTNDDDDDDGLSLKSAFSKVNNIAVHNTVKPRSYEQNVNPKKFTSLDIHNNWIFYEAKNFDFTQCEFIHRCESTHAKSSVI